MKKLVFAAIAAMVMVSVSNVFAVSKMASDSQVAPVDTVAPATPTDSTVVETPAETPTESVDTTQKEAPVQTEEKVEENTQEKTEENAQQQTNEVQQTTEPSTVAE